MKLFHLLIFLCILFLCLRKSVEKQTDCQLEYVSIDDPRLKTNYVTLVTFAKNKENGKSEKYLLSKGPTPKYRYGRFSFRNINKMNLRAQKSNFLFALEKADNKKFYLKTRPLYPNAPSMYVKTEDKLTDTIFEERSSPLQTTNNDIKPLVFKKVDKDAYELENFDRNVYIEISCEKIPQSQRENTKVDTEIDTEVDSEE